MCQLYAVCVGGTTQRYESPGGGLRGCLSDSNHEIYRVDKDEILDDHG